MTTLRFKVVLIAASFAAACAEPSTPDAPDGNWVGKITTDGNLTTVVNESGSVWGGAATLVEEASIGVNVGPAEYMFGRVGATVAFDDRVYVSDLSVPAVRVYTTEGEYLEDIGREGQGPGEYTYPSELAVSDDGRLFVYNRGNVIVYSERGEHLHTYALPRQLDVPFVVTADGTTFGGVIVDREATYYRLAVGLMAHGPQGPYGEPLLPPRYEVAVPHVGGGRGLPVPHAEEYVWTMDRRGNLIAGASASYRFEVARPDRTRVIVERAADPVPVSAEERADQIRSMTNFMDRTRGDGWSWDGPPVPDAKAAYLKFMPTHSGQLWVLRAGASEKYADSSWWDTYLIDAFDQEGRYLGPVLFPAQARRPMGAFATDHGGPFAFVHGTTVWTSVEDEAGTIMVKRYRLELPGERSTAR